MNPDSDNPKAQIIQFLLEGCQTVETAKDKDGNEFSQLIVNPKKVGYKSHIVNSPTFGRYVFYREILEDKAAQAIFHMTRERARVLASQIMDYCESLDYSIDAKSSECLRDSNNTQSTLLHILNSNKIEKQYTMKDAVKTGILDGFLGKKVNDDASKD